MYVLVQQTIYISKKYFFQIILGWPAASILKCGGYKANAGGGGIPA